MFEKSIKFISKANGMYKRNYLLFSGQSHVPTVDLSMQHQLVLQYSPQHVPHLKSLSEQKLPDRIAPPGYGRQDGLFDGHQTHCSTNQHGNHIDTNASLHGLT